MVLSKDLKKAIAFGLIIGALISICSMCFASEVETLSPSVIDNFYINGSGVIGSTSSNLNLYYVEMQQGYKYYLTNNSPNNSKRVGVCNQLVVGTEVDYFTDLVAGQTFTFDGDGRYLYIVASSSNDVFLFSREKLQGLDDFVGDIAYYLSFENLGEVVVFVVPILAIAVLFALGFYFIKRILNKTKKTKGGV